MIDKDPTLKDRLSGARAAVLHAAQRYAMEAEAGALHLLNANTFIVPGVTTKEMTKLYNNRLVRGTAGRDVYDELMMAAPRGRCPLCGQRDVSTLEHILPKSAYPALAVTP